MMGLFENMQHDVVSSLNLREPVLAKPDEPLRDVLRAMRHHHLGCAILVDDDRRPVGMFTENMLTRIIATNPASIDDAVAHHAAQQLPQVRLTDPVLAVLEALDLKNVRFLAVVDEHGRIAALTGQKGLMEYVADHFPRQVMVQHVGSRAALRTREGA